MQISEEDQELFKQTDSLPEEQSEEEEELESLEKYNSQSME
jgi:hypothetical protein